MPKRTNLNAGRCTLYLSRHHNRASVLCAAARYLTGNAESDPKLEIVQGKRIALGVRGRKSTLAAIDGELERVRLPLELDLLPAALNVLTPRKADERGEKG